MSFLKIRCGCGRSWEVYWRSQKDEHSRQCPHCLEKIDSQTWEKQILPAWGQVSDANGELQKDALGYHLTEFSFDVISDVKVSDSDRRREEDLSEMRDEIAEVKDSVDDLKEAVSMIFLNLR